MESGLSSLRISVNGGPPVPGFLCVFPNMRGSYPRNCFALPWTLAYLCTNAIGNNTSPGFTWEWSKSWGCNMQIFGSLMPRAYAIALASVQHRIPIRLEAGIVVHQRYQERPWRVLRRVTQPDGTVNNRVLLGSAWFRLQANRVARLVRQPQPGTVELSVQDNLDVARGYM